MGDVTAASAVGQGGWPDVGQPARHAYLVKPGGQAIDYRLVEYPKITARKCNLIQRWKQTLHASGNKLHRNGYQY